MSLQRMDNVLIVVDDLEAAKSFFVELGMELEGETSIEGRWVDLVVGLENVQCEMRSRGHHRWACRAARVNRFRMGVEQLSSHVEIRLHHGE